jgi:hypothetical protein
MRFLIRGQAAGEALPAFVLASLAEATMVGAVLCPSRHHAVTIICRSAGRDR